MRGNILYPLNELKNIFPDVYEEGVKRYEGREHVMEEKIPVLNCFWNDVLHLAAVDPREIKAELAKLGKEISIKSFYKINPNFLDPKNTIVYLYQNPIPNDVLIEEDFVPYNPAIITKINILPEATKRYYAETMGKDGKVLLWHRIPHVLYKGTIDVSNLEVLEI